MSKVCETSRVAFRTLAAVCAVLVLWSSGPVAIDTRLTDVTEARATGGMIALLPRAADAQMLTVVGGEPADELHLTLIDFGPDVSGRSGDDLARRLGDLMTRWAGEVKADVFGHATFSPGRPGECAVYLVGDSPELVDLRASVTEVSTQLYQLPPQHDPWVPHITAKYGVLEGELTYSGPVMFDRVRLRWAGETRDFALHPAG
ncbi:hypothetical protein MycrhN_5454 [Mycolicibacterium rhodesiae NBB3]|uniref:2'-5' RNA ligase n=1 Tax=Mycolicibacterium rhodesiae (strain NBB3) TaxID=710685 RepID=G8RIM1_MYCRN|nr:hypothetical protein MycrhN_5454 [Mycolicibacterium rhodesiae NBB3]